MPSPPLSKLPTLLIVYHSHTGGTQQMASAAAAGAVAAARSGAGGWVVAASRPPYALLVCAGSDGSSAVRQVERIATGWRLRKVAPSLIVCTHAQTPEAILAPKTIAQPDLAACADIGEALGQGLVMGLF